MTPNSSQIKLLKAVSHGAVSDKSISASINLGLEETRYLMREMRGEYITYAEGTPFEPGPMEYMSCRLTDKGRVTATNSDFLLPSNQSSPSMTFNAPVGNAAGINYGEQKAIQHNYAPEKQSLAEAAAEIQRLLQQLEQANPDATLEQKKTFVDLGVSPTLKQRAIAALKSGGQAAIEEFLDNLYVNVGMAIVTGWIEGA